MSNMSYCRFQNTYGDLQDCYENFDDDLTDSPEEEKARKWMLQLCQKIVNEFSEELEDA